MTFQASTQYVNFCSGSLIACFRIVEHTRGCYHNNDIQYEYTLEISQQCSDTR